MKKIPIEDIDLSDLRFRFSYFFSEDHLVQSIREIGLVNPPVVTCREGRFILLTGWKRIMACRSLSLSPIPVFICREENDLKAFRLAVFENLTTRRFDLIERAEILKILKRFGETEQDIIQKHMPLLGIPPTFDYFDLFRKISRFSNREKRVVQDKRMNLGVVEQLVRFSPGERKLLIPLLHVLSQNKRKELLEMAKEVSLKEGISVKDILNSGKFKAAVNSEKFSPAQKAERIRALFKKKRFPRLSARQGTFESAKKKLAWPEDVDISPTPFFEDEDVHVKFSFKDKENFLKKLSFLQEIAAREDFADFFETLSDE